MFHLDTLATLVAATLTLLLGRKLVHSVSFLKKYTIPEPVAGGLLVALALLVLKKSMGWEVNFDMSLRDPLMLAFFATIGLNANIASLRAGGRVVGIFLIVVVGLLVMQNAIGIGMASLLGLDPLMGLLAGSITLSGGHGTGAAWSKLFIERYGFTNATEVAMACATFGLVLGGLIGGPVARQLTLTKGNKSWSSTAVAAALELVDPPGCRNSISSLSIPSTSRGGPVPNSPYSESYYARYLVKHSTTPNGIPDDQEVPTAFEKPDVGRMITSLVLIETIALIAICLTVGKIVAQLLAGTAFELPTFVCVLFVGVILSNGLSIMGFYRVFERAVSVLGNVSLSLFLAMALMGLKLWELASLALPMLAILVVQTIFMALYAIFVTWRMMGKNYDAAVLAAGHCGFGLGATPTAIANMQAITERFGPSHMAFLVVPMVGAFFIDIVNALVIKLYLMLPIFAG
nr:glutamate permease [synthetic construct]CAA06474.1 glutamate permease [synthetic construct]CAA06477.1 glutamate permease [synthetic construct]